MPTIYVTDPFEEEASGPEMELMTGNIKEEDKGGGGCKRRLRSKPILVLGGCCLTLL